MKFDTPATFKKNLLKFLKQCKYLYIIFLDDSSDNLLRPATAPKNFKNNQPLSAAIQESKILYVNL